jgi:hypothetical protein
MRMALFALSLFSREFQRSHTQTFRLSLARLTVLAAMPVLLISDLAAQDPFCPGDPPVNPYLADSPWPTYHRNGYRQKSTCIAGPVPGDSLRVKVRANLNGRTSPWTYISDRYADGSRVLLQSNATHVFKFRDTPEGIETIDSLRIDFDPITSFGWNFILAKDKIWYTYYPKYDPESNEYTRLFKLTDADTLDPLSDIVALDTFNFGGHGIGRVQLLALNHNGELVFNPGLVGVISADLVLLDTLQFASFPGEITYHNAFPVEENNAFYIVTTHRMMRFDWSGTELSLAWQSLYDFVFDGPNGSFAEGSGTTPTLLGWGAGNDKLVVVCDGHARNNAVAFWRELPEGWTGVPGMDIHFADSIQLPAAGTFSNIFQSIENSPCAFGYDFAMAQFNGFLGQPCMTRKGVQKVHWDTLSNALSIAWSDTSININGVLTYSEGSNLVYGSGKEADCNYYYYGLDWNTGGVVMRTLLGPEQGAFFLNVFDDGGNGNVIDEEGNIWYTGGSSLVKLEVVEQTVQVADAPLGSGQIRLVPNPASTSVRIDLPMGGATSVIMVNDLLGRKVRSIPFVGGTCVLDVSTMPVGAYALSVRDQAGAITRSPALLVVDRQ